MAIPAGAPGRFSVLPVSPRLEDTIAEVETRGVPDPEGGRDTERDWIVRYGIGGLF